MTKLGVRTKASVRNLGIDFGAGRASTRNKRQVLIQRMGKVGRWMRRAAGCKGGGRREVMRAAVKPAISYGAAVSALPRAYIKKLRAEAARGYGPIGGRSVTARFAIEGADIELTFNEKPIMYWVEGLWDGLVDGRTMNCAWRQACSELAGVGDRDDTMLGGARAHVKAVRRLGWGMPTFDTVITRDKTILYFGEGAAPGNAMQADARIIESYVEDDFQRVALKGSALERDINDIEGGRGYCRMVQGGMVEKNAARIWRRGRFEHEDGRAIPWLWPVRTVVRAARRA